MTLLHHNVQLILFILAAFTLQSVGSKRQYPLTSLQCYSYLTKPDMKLICPASRYFYCFMIFYKVYGCFCRENYCVKQVSSLTQDICGGTQYFGDLYVNKECVFKKCNATCSEGTENFEFQGNTYSRSTYCCKTDYCNSAIRKNAVSIMTLLILISITVLVLSIWPVI